MPNENINVVEILGLELFEGLQSRYMARWYDEITCNDSVIIFKCEGEGMWNITKDGKYVDNYSFHNYEENALIAELTKILS